MEVVFLIPGIMGTSLVLPAKNPGDTDEEVWPPTPSEAALKYKRLHKLMDPALKPGSPIHKVACYNFYSLLRTHLDDLGYPNDDSAKRRVEFGYDWRLDNVHTADLLAQRIEAEYAKGARSISLVAHSMGGMVARLLLEGGKYNERPWFKSIRLLVTLATPHLGAPLALARIFGLDGVAGLNASDVAKLANNPAYPSAYQLIPAPDEAAIWSMESPDLASVDPYDADSAKDLGLVPELLERARAVHDVLGREQRPEHVRYVYFAGSGHRTLTRVNVVHTPGQAVQHSQSRLTFTDDAGDGTVPLYSSLPSKGQRQIVINEHSTVFKGSSFRRAFFRLLGGDAGTALENADNLDIEGSLLSGSLDRQAYAIGQEVELTLQVVNRSLADEAPPIDKITGELVLERLHEVSLVPLTIARLPLTYQGTPLRRLSTLLADITSSAGLYRLTFEGKPSLREALPFVVTAND
ncbi:alpha/beta hydrolase [Pseudomonas sp. M20]|uniref:lipase/acyltransferase domain-containing protein n=1 Tax=Pseudomonas sp. M20 TaxID=3379129 RepID=UPI00386AB3D3